MTKSTNNMQKSAPTRRIKIVTLGDSSTGKSSLIKRYCERRFDKRNNSTVALDYGSIQVNIRASEKDDSNLVYVDFWDLSGKPEYLSVRSECYLPCPSAALLVYDVNNRASFESLEEWLKELRRQGVNKNDNVPITLCANKIDGIQRAVTRRDGMTFKEKHKLHSYFEVSAIEGTSVDVMFRSLFESAVGS